jgi:hypothetical protein
MNRVHLNFRKRSHRALIAALYRKGTPWCGFCGYWIMPWRGHSR